LSGQNHVATITAIGIALADTEQAALARLESFTLASGESSATSLSSSRCSFSTALNRGRDGHRLMEPPAVMSEWGKVRIPIVK
jgi:hypothetical protein